MQPIRIYNRYLDLKAEIDTYQSLQFGRNYHAVADFELHINRYMHKADEIFKGDIIGLAENKAGIILSKEIALDQSGKESENFKLTGYTLDGLIKRRITVPPSDTAYDRKSGDAETVMKHYVTNHFVNPDDIMRRMPYIEVAPNQQRGSHVEWESRFKNVADELESISIESGLGWGVFADFKNKRLIFDVIQRKDLTQDNAYGNSPVFFSPEFETIKNQDFIDSDNDLKTVGYVGGQGEGTERKVVTIGNDNGWDRIETFVDARDVGNSENDDEQLTPEEIEQQLRERGQEKMQDMQTIFTLEAEILTPVTRTAYEYTHEGYLQPAQPTGRYERKQQQVTPFAYEKDFDLGDNVQVVNKSWGLTMTAPITAFKEIHEPGGFRLEATFGRDRPTLISKLNKKFDEIEGIEKQELPAQVAVETRKYIDEGLTQEEKERIEQAKQNLAEAKGFTKDYAEKKRIESTTEPSDKDVIWIDTSNPDNVVWKVYRNGAWVEGPSGPRGPRGLQGIQGPEGEQGIQGPAGEASYTHIAYANSADGTDGFSTSNSTDKLYIGMYVDTNPTDSTTPSNYNWTRIKGLDGSDGIQGPAGDDGRTPYFHIAYANSADGSSGFSTTDSSNKDYIGQYTDYIQSDSTDPSDYKWSKIKGEQGPRGLQGIEGPRGIPGQDGSSTFTHIAYANSADGTVDFSTTNGTDKKYVGMYISYRTASGDYMIIHDGYLTPAQPATHTELTEPPPDSEDPADYKWTRIKGMDGEQGIPGPAGDDGQTPYLHIAYATSADGSTGFSTSDSTGKTHIGQYTDYAQADSTNPADYKWSEIKGEKGDQGPNVVDKNTGFGSGYDPSKKETPQGAQDKANNAEQNAKDYSEDASNLMRGIMDVASVPIQTAANGARIEFDGQNGFVQYDANNNPVSWLDLKGDARFKGRVEASEGFFGDNLRLRNGKLEIIRDDGAISMNSGMVKNGLTVVGNDPHYMTSGESQTGKFESFMPGGTIKNTSYHIYGATKGTLDGRGLDGTTVNYHDVRDDLGALAFQKYDFIHSARYLVFRFRKYTGSTISVHIVKGSSDNVDDRLYYEKIDDGSSGVKEFRVDLGVPDYSLRTVTFKIGWTHSWGGRMEFVRFIMERVYLTDFN